MLVAGHIGYTVAAFWEAQQRTKRRFDLRLVGLMALLPDALDRALYVFVLRDARRGRNLNHSLIGNLAIPAALVAYRRNLWPYALASLGHLLLDSQLLSSRQAFWPALGRDLKHIGIERRATSDREPYRERVWERLKEVIHTYGEATLLNVAFDAGGLLALGEVVRRERLFHRVRLRRFLMSGHLEAAA